MDHNWHQVSVIPTAMLLQDIPEEVNQSWLSGQLICALKDGVLQGSSAWRGATELLKAVEKECPIIAHKVLFLNKKLFHNLYTRVDALVTSTHPHPLPKTTRTFSAPTVEVIKT